MRVHKILTEAPVPFKLPQYMMNDPSSIDLKGLGAQAKREADRAAAEKARADALAANKVKYQDLINKVSSIENPEDALEALFQELVPASGSANTVAGELARAMMRILYRDYNDGDVFYEGYGIETCGSSVAYIISIIDDLYDDFQKIADRSLQDDDYTKALDAICAKVCAYILSHDDVWETNEEDSRSDKYDQLYSNEYQKDWEPEYEYDFQIPPTIQEYIDAGHIITDEFIEQVKSALDNNWSTKYDDVEDSWSNYVNITGLKREGYDEVESWRMWDDSFWSDYIDELVDEYGDLDEDEDDDEDDFDESLNKGEKGSDIQPLKDVKLAENTHDQVIIGFSADGTRSYYNESDNTWRSSVAEATIYPNNDVARRVWFTLDKKPFKRVFIVCNTPGL